MPLIRYLFAQSPKLLFMALISGMVSGLCGAALAAVISLVVAGRPDHATLVGIYVLLCATYLCAKVHSELSMIRLTQGAIFRMQNDLSHNIVATPLTKLETIGKHGLMSILTKDIDTFMQAGETLPQAFVNGVIMLGCMGYLASLSPGVFAVFLASLLTCGVVFHFAERTPRRNLVRIRVKSDALYKHFRSLVEGIRELKQNKARAEVFVAQRIEREGAAFRQTFITSMTGYTWIINAGTLLLYVSIGICVFLIPRSNEPANALLTQSTVILLYLIRPITGLMMLLPLIRQSGVALSRILQLTRDLGVRTECPDAVNPFIAPSLSLELSEVCYDRKDATTDATFSLGPITLEINRGDVVFIAGGNGSGKTTLVHILLGLYRPSRGRIILNGHAVTDRNIHFYREFFSAILSDAFVFDFLVGPERSTIESRAAQYLERLRIAHKVDLLGTDLSTVELSSGQRKRLALVAAYVEDRPVFVFDEWAAEQEPDLKARFYQEIVPNLKALGKTVLVITHDDTYFDRADVLVILEDGRIREVRSKRSNAVHPPVLPGIEGKHSYVEAR